MQTYITSGNIHQVNQRDKVIAVSLIEILRLFGTVQPEKMVYLPFDLLNDYAVAAASCLAEL